MPRVMPLSCPYKLPTPYGLPCKLCQKAMTTTTLVRTVQIKRTPFIVHEACYQWEIEEKGGTPHDQQH